MFQAVLTKLVSPRIGAAQVQRSHLLSKLGEGISNARLILVSAQAGAGKTTLVGQWIASYPDLEIIWLSLDKADNDPARFWSYIVTAFSTKLPGLKETGKQLLEMLQHPQLVLQPAPVETILTELINTILQQFTPASKDICLVLDDYHLITNQTIHQAMTGLLDFLPSNLHLLIATRSDPELPLARLRARGQLLELRIDDLRFSLNEATTFYNTSMNLALSAAEIATLEKRTEGWAAGMQLLALSLRGLADPKREEFIRSFSGTNRYIIDYLVQEILENLPQEAQQFLLQTSILQRLNGELCEAIFQPDESKDEPEGQKLENEVGRFRLESLAAENIFVSPLDEHGEWFRYHQLFAAVLQHRLARIYPPEFRRLLHLRAAKWFGSHGWNEDAVAHYLAAQEYTEAAEFILNTLGEWWQRGELVSLVRWIEKLPEQVREKHPLLEITRAWPAVLAGQIGQVAEILQGFEHRLSISDALTSIANSGEASTVLSSVPEFSPVARACINFLKGYMAVARANWPEAISYLEAALPGLLENTGLEQALPWWLMALTSLGWAYRFTGNPQQASNVYDRAIALCRANRDFTALLGAVSYRTELDEEAGQLRLADRVYREAIREAEEKFGAGLPRVYLSSLYAGLGRICYHRNELPEAESYFNQALHFSQSDQNLPVIIQALEGLARIALVQGDFGRAFALLDEMQAEAQPEHLDDLRQYIQAMRAQFDLRQHRLAQASAWAENLLQRYPDYLSLPPVHLRENRLLVLARVWLAEGNVPKVLTLLSRQLEISLYSGQHSKVLEIYLLQALALYPQPSAFTLLEKAVSLAAPESYLRTFLDEGLPALRLLQASPDSIRNSAFGKKLLTAFGETVALIPHSESTRELAPRSSTLTLLQGQFEPLSEREKEVLRGLAEGLSNRALADKLIVTENTAKVHIRNIFSKLNVNSRTQALVRAKELGLI